jgi:adenylate kinase
VRPVKGGVRLIFLGSPGAGKGTQARELAREWGVPQVATGDMLRDAVAAGTPLGRQAKAYMDRGSLVPDEVIIGLIAERLAQSDAEHGFILDGFPRTIPQAEALDRLLKDLGRPLERVIFFEVSEPELLRRLTGRRSCPACQSTYHLVSAPPRQPGVCDRCGSALVQREDDREETVRKRLAVYASQTEPLLAYYRDRGLLVSVPGEGSIETIRGGVRRAADVRAVPADRARP